MIVALSILIALLAVVAAFVLIAILFLQSVAEAQAHRIDGLVKAVVDTQERISRLEAQAAVEKPAARRPRLVPIQKSPGRAYGYPRRSS